MSREYTQQRHMPDVFDMADTLVRLSTQTDSFGFDSNMTNPKAAEGQVSERFPEHLLVILNSHLGNKMCVDCRKFKELTWASTSFGVLMCEECAFEHMSSGLTENCTNVKSLIRNTWNLQEVIALLEGGNSQFLKFVDANTTQGIFEDNRRWASTGNLLNARATNNVKEDDFSKYKKKYANLYIKKLADRIKAVTNTFGKSQGFNSRGQMKVIEDPSFKPMKSMTDPDNGDVFL